jgi:hypothetical protein
MRVRALRAPALLAFLAPFVTVATSIVATPSAALAAGTSTSAGVRAIARDGEAQPWLYVGKANVRSAMAGDDMRAHARAVLVSMAPYAAALDFGHAGVQRFGDGDVVVTLEQTHRGLPVIGRGAAVRLNARGESVLSTVRVETDLPASIVPALSAEQAAGAAQSMTALAIAAGDAHLVILPTPEGARLAYAVIPAVPTGVPSAPRVMIDAVDGRVLEARDMVVFMNQAKVYESNPIASPLITKTLEMAPDGSGHLQNPFIQSQNCVDNKSVKTLNVGIDVTIHVCDLTQLATADTNGDFLYEPADEATDPNSRRDTFAEVSMYHHASKVYSFFRGLQGDPNAQITADKPLRTISNLQTPHGLLGATPDLKAAADPNVALDPLQNAFFSPAGQGLGVVFEQLYGFSAGAMWFGQGPRRDYSYDGDVVYHEFTHAVVDETLKLGVWHVDKYGAIDAPGAMNEGLADYFSSALSGDPKMGEYAAKDLLASLSIIRTLDNTDTCPATVTGEVHFDSTLFSGGLWKTRASLASETDRTKFDAAIYKAMRSSGGQGDIGYDDATTLFLATLKTDFPAGATALEAEMTARGVLPACTRVFDVNKGPALPPPATIFSPGAFTAPGTANFTGAKMAPGMIQAKLDLPAGATHVKVSFDVPPPRQAPGFLGGGGTPFKPVVLAKFGGAIEWTTKGALASNAQVTIDPTATGSTTKTYAAAIDIPAGATSVYVQVANKGSSDGSYKGLSVTSETVVPDAGAPDPGGETPDAGTGAGATPSDTSDSGGCACQVPAHGVTAPAGGAALALFGLVSLVGRRRRK